jgi:mannose-6-phosphate isomerase class I
MIERLRRDDRRSPAGADDPAYWALRADREFSRPGRPDPGIFLVFLLNLVRLAPGDAVFLGSGIIHSYLRGAGIEVMANSDNVVRCGLTGKHVDIPELLRIANYGGGIPRVVPRPSGEGSETVYPTPAVEFELRKLELRPQDGELLRRADGPELLVLIGGQPEARVTLRAGGVDSVLCRASACIVPGGTAYGVGTTAHAVMLRARIPGRELRGARR